MARRKMPLVGGFRDPDIYGVNFSLPINWQPSYYENREDLFLSMVPSPGTQRFYKVPQGIAVANNEYRGAIVMNGSIYVVVGDKLLKLSPTISSNELTGFSTAELGTLGTNTGQVQMAYSTDFELGIVDGVHLYSYKASLTTAPETPFETVSLTTTQLEKANDIEFLDQRFIITIKDSQTYYVSPASFAANSSRLRTTYTVNDWAFANITARADTLKGIKVNNLNFYLFGTRVIETWTDAGVSGNPFRRINSQVYDVGAASTDSIAQATGPNGEDITVFLASDTKGALNVMMLGHGGVQSIANKAIQGFLADNIRSKQDAIGAMFRDKNDLYYQITFPTDNITLVYDFERQEWHQRKALDGGRHHANIFVHFDEEDFRGGYNFVGDYNSTRMYWFSSDIYTDALDGTTFCPAGTKINGKVLQTDTNIENTAITIHKSYTAPYISSPEEKKVIINRVELNCVQGTGRNDYDDRTYTEDKEPNIRLSASRDKGRTFETMHQGSVGKVGFYKRRTRYHRFGHSHDGWVLKAESYSKQPIIMISMILDYEVGDE